MADPLNDAERNALIVFRDAGRPIGVREVDLGTDFDDEGEAGEVVESLSSKGLVRLARATGGDAEPEGWDQTTWEITDEGRAALS